MTTRVTTAPTPVIQTQKQTVPYLFNTPEQQRQMLETIGVSSIEELFDILPPEVRLQRPLDVPAAMSELELQAHMRNLAARNVGAAGSLCFAGGGAYDHFIPAVVDEITGRGEFYTAYTPYQAEASQGSLQAFFEFQTLICQLTGMDVANASLYEGGTSVSEAAFMAMRVTRRHGRMVVLGSLHPEYRQVLQTYFNHLDCEIVEIPTPEGTADLEQVQAALDDQTACLIIQHPNFFGCLEDAEALTALARAAGALSIICCDPISLGILKRPGDYGADIVVAEGQSLGIPLQYGGPYLGVMACREEHVRKMPGRLIGQTTDRNGKRSYVLNLQAREQHIRREKATSNICTNQGLMALRATIYLTMLGKEGIRELAELCCRKAHYAAERLSGLVGFDLMFDRPFFKEFALRTERIPAELCQAAIAAGFQIGPSFDRFTNPGAVPNAAVPQGLMIAVTEKRTREEIDRLVATLDSI